MSRESIIQIKKTEETAARMVAEARERAKEMIARAEADGQAMCAATEKETAAELAAMMVQLRERTAQTSERIGAESVEEAAELKKTVALRRKMAEKMILRGFDQKCR
ncbi:MAG: hypothetical protein IJW55_02460 [Clostridia bacterium]|nr:hypothetical protein [Clostridia bacterium]